jgi:hypothetical protein
MPKWAKTIIAILLLPLCLGAVRTLWSVVATSGHAQTAWVALLGGVACWIVVFLLLPRPMWLYVVGHELTHAIWVWLCGGKVKKFKVSSKGGSVVVSKSNFLIALAPYFFPIYAVLLVLVFLAGHLVWNWSALTPWFHLLLGAAYAFHVTLTVQVLQTRQSDITSQGYVFSAVVIFLGNVLVLMVAVPLLTGRTGLLTVLGWWMQDTGGILRRFGAMLTG